MRIIDIHDRLPVNSKKPSSKRQKPIKRIVIHCTADDDKPGADVYGCAAYDVGPNHISAGGCPTITYSYYIEEVNGDVHTYKCVEHDIVTWHVGIWNESSLGIAIDKQADDLAPSKLQAAIELSAYLCKELNLSHLSVFFHRELEITGWNWNVDKTKKILRKTCPGMAWDGDTFRQKVREELEKYRKG